MNLTPSEFAAECGVSRWAIYRGIEDGRLRAYRFGKHTLRIRRADADRYIESCRVKPTPITKRGGRMPREHGADIMEIARRLALREVGR